MIDNKLIIFACKVLEYQPEPSNQWTTVGQLETGRNAHAVLSIDSEALPCLQGCLEQDDLFVGSQYYRQDYHYQQSFHHHHHPACQIVIYMPLLEGGKTIMDKSLPTMIMIIISLQALRVLEALNNFSPGQSPFSLNRI